MKILIIGKGKVGEATAQSLACEVDYHDPYKGIVVENFNDYKFAIVCVDTLRKSTDDHSDLSDVLTLLNSKNYNGVIAIRCTVSPEYLKIIENKFSKLNIVLFPEFMRQTDDLKMDTPWIVVIGGDNKHTQSFKHFLYEEGYCTHWPKFHLVSMMEACIIKLCQNAGLATRVIYWNAVNEICEKYNAEFSKVKTGVGADTRVGLEYSVVPSPDDGLKGFKGHCLPKDVACLASVETEHGFFKKLLEINKLLGR